MERKEDRVRRREIRELTFLVESSFVDTSFSSEDDLSSIETSTKDPVPIADEEGDGGDEKVEGIEEVEEVEEGISSPASPGLKEKRQIDQTRR